MEETWIPIKMLGKIVGNGSNKSAL